MRLYQWTIGREAEIEPEYLDGCYEGLEFHAHSPQDAALCATPYTWGDIISVRPDDDHSDVTVWRVIVEDGRTTVEEVT